MQKNVKRSSVGVHFPPLFLAGTPPGGRRIHRPKQQPPRQAFDEKNHTVSCDFSPLQTSQIPPALQLPNESVPFLNRQLGKGKTETGKAAQLEFEDGQLDETPSAKTPSHLPDFWDSQAQRQRQGVFAGRADKLSVDNAVSETEEANKKQWLEQRTHETNLIDGNVFSVFHKEIEGSTGSPIASIAHDDTFLKKWDTCLSSFGSQRSMSGALRRQQEHTINRTPSGNMLRMQNMFSSSGNMSTNFEDSTMEDLKRKKRLSRIALQKRSSLAAVLGVRNETYEDDPSLMRMLGRETHKRRVKKNAHSIYSVEMPSFEDATGALGDERVFPGSLTVDDAIRHVLEQERGELKMKKNGIGITNFLKNFLESRQIIYLYFWYIVAHMRRADAERMLICRYANLERLFRSIFPHHKSDLPPLSQLLETVTEMMDSFSSMRKRTMSLVGVSRKGSVEEGRQELLSRKISMAKMSSSRRESIIFGNKDASLQDSNTHGANGSQLLEQGKKYMAFVSEISPVHDGLMVMSYANAVDVFILMYAEICELADFSWKCFRRLAILFGCVFERLETDRDEVFNAFMILVPHVTYYVLLYCFPNDVVAGLFNKATQLNLYRIFHYWCSGLVPTYVRLSGWPKRPLQKSKDFTAGPEKASEKPVKAAVAGDENGDDDDDDAETRRAAAGREGEGKRKERVVKLEGLKRNTASPSTPSNEDNNQGSPQPMDGLINEPTGRMVSRNPLRPLNDNSFEDVDVEVANGHYRLIIEFKKYMKHANFLLQELEQRTTGMYQEVSQVASEQEPKKVVEKKSVKDKSILPKASEKLLPIRTAKVVSSSLSQCADGRCGHTSGGFTSTLTQHGRTGLEKEQVTTVSSTPKSSNALFDFPLDEAPENVKQYVLREGAVRLWEVPLPPLESERTSHSLGQRADVLTTLQGSRSTTQCTRSAKVPLPLTSPLFMEYANWRFVPNALVGTGYPAWTESSVDNNTSHVPRDNEIQVNDNGLRESSLVPFAAPNQGIAEKRVFPLPRVTQKRINVTLISPSDMQLRPLKFRSFTREVKKRQEALQKHQNTLLEQEMQLRWQYDMEAQRGLRLVDRLLDGCEPKQPLNSMRRRKDVSGRRMPDAKRGAGTQNQARGEGTCSKR